MTTATAVLTSDWSKVNSRLLKMVERGIWARKFEKAAPGAAEASSNPRPSATFKNAARGDSEKRIMIQSSP